MALNNDQVRYRKWVAGGGGRFDIPAILDNPHAEITMAPDTDREAAMKAQCPMFHEYLYLGVVSKESQTRLKCAEKKLRWWQNPKLMKRHMAKNYERDRTFIASTSKTKTGEKKRNIIYNDPPALEAWIKKKKQDVARKVMLIADLMVHLNQEKG